MSFLDNLENNLKSLESQEEGKGDAERQQRDRENRRASAQAAAPYAEELKKGPHTAELLKQATRIGFGMRLKVYYDVGNCTQAGFDVVKEIRWLGKDRICQFHFKDN